MLKTNGTDACAGAGFPGGRPPELAVVTGKAAARAADERRIIDLGATTRFDQAGRKERANPAAAIVVKQS